ncbi:hypothetical protein GQ43DRAFT_479746 [Delitschia confertaspora ATCC 74209]|uniref:UBA domain-containing protein n=1 Tax=Delitschia confertaspora ATCC 74209 TaxID=1513339 RepID=A0A9P4JNP3_9PLEO|nr:hypothetical protein GQ43DRAFT_479746 [Delitschia confertaspora ATCC 74209]
MDDLAGLDWSAPSNTAPKPSASPYAPFRQNPSPQLSARSTPLSAQQSGNNPNPSRVSKLPSKPATPANDSFAGLVSLNSAKPATTQLSLQERQKQLQEEKLRQETERRKQYDAHFGGSGTDFLDTLGSGKNTPEPAISGRHQPGSSGPGAQSLSRTINKPFAGLDTRYNRPRQASPVEDDLLSAFSAATPVDASSHFPPSSSLESGRSTPAQNVQSSLSHTSILQKPMNPFEDDDDPFGLNHLAQKPVSTVQAQPVLNDDDDILGLLSKPVSEFQNTSEQTQSPVCDDGFREDTPPRGATDPRDKAVAELVDMGFPADKAARALAQTESGVNVQAAVGLLLNQAHEEARQKTQGRNTSRGRRSPEVQTERQHRSNGRPSARDTSSGGSVPAWMKGNENRTRSSQRRQDNQTPDSEKDVAQIASDIGSTLFKSANSLWKSGQKKVQRAVADFQQDGDPSVPKWMRDAQVQTQKSTPRDDSLPQLGRPQRATPAAAIPSVTDEALLLESGGRPTKPPRPSSNHAPDSYASRQPRENTPNNNPFTNRTSTQSPSFPHRPQNSDKRPSAKLTRQDVEEQSAQAYISPARRKKATPKPDDIPSQKPTPSPNSTRQPTLAQSNNPFLQQTARPTSRSPAVTPPVQKSKPPPRRIPPASSSALSSSTAYRQKGSEAFKRGDYSAAHTSYTAALAPLPQNHPVAIIVLCNRAVTNIKVGDPKAAVSDADAALAIIGELKGEGETIALGGTEGDKEMKDFFGKALMRKAEALEHMEKWADAAKVWKEAVEAGVGGSISIQGRNRCEKAAGGGNKPTTAPAKRLPVRKPAPPKPSALSDLRGGPASETAAVKRLREANVAAEKADDEKFALTDQVDSKLTAWKGSKSDNLRALLGSLDKVLWPEAGWNKVNMGDLVMPNKVKIVYMKAIAKVHPDKISQTATTEQRMISAAVFSTLNEAWDKFKNENGL